MSRLIFSEKLKEIFKVSLSVAVVIGALKVNQEKQPLVYANSDNFDLEFNGLVNTIKVMLSQC